MVLGFLERRKFFCSSFFTQKFYIKLFFPNVIIIFSQTDILSFNITTMSHAQHCSGFTDSDFSKLNTFIAVLFTQLNRSFLIRTVLRHGPGSKKFYPQP